MKPPALHLSPLLDVLATVAMISLGTLDLVGPPRGLHVTNDGSGCVEWRDPVEATLHVGTRGVHLEDTTGGPQTPTLALEAFRAQRPTAKRLALRIHDNVELQQVIAVLDACVAAGFEDVRVGSW
jgi:hypothetical protein